MATPDIPISLALVDDSMPLRTLMSAYLARQGFEILYEASNGQELLDQMSQGHRLPDLCLLDSSMPVMNGPQTATILKRTYPSIQIMAYSFFDENETADNMLECGAHSFISKDAEAVEVRDALRGLYWAKKGHDDDAVAVPAL